MPEAQKPKPQTDKDRAAWLAHIERMFDKQGERTEGLLACVDQRVATLEDTLLATTKRAKNRMAILEDTLEKKLSTVDKAHKDRGISWRRLEKRIEEIAKMRGQGDDGTAREPNAEPQPRATPRTSLAPTSIWEARRSFKQNKHYNSKVWRRADMPSPRTNFAGWHRETSRREKAMLETWPH